MYTDWLKWERRKFSISHSPKVTDWLVNLYLFFVFHFCNSLKTMSTFAKEVALSKLYPPSCYLISTLKGKKFLPRDQFSFTLSHQHQSPFQKEFGVQEIEQEDKVNSLVTAAENLPHVAIYHFYLHVFGTVQWVCKVCVLTYPKSAL